MAAPTASAETAANFGYTLAFFNSNAELKSLLASATAGSWTPGRFVAALQNTKWFRTASESTRKYAALKASDPATFASQIKAGTSHVLAVSGALGATVSPQWAAKIADTAMQVGWTDEQLREYITGAAGNLQTGNYAGGKAAALHQQFQALASDYGVTVSDSTMRDWVRQGLLGGQDADSIRNRMVDLASSKYVALADRLKSGETVRQIADPYMQSYAKLLEVDGDNISLDDPLIQRALQAKDAKGKPTTQTVYDFEQTLRSDARWRKTDNAQDVGMAAANAILKQFGKVAG